MSENTETAILAAGCFWPAQELLRRHDGVISARVGYTGGENDNPTAGNHPGHERRAAPGRQPHDRRRRRLGHLARQGRNQDQRGRSLLGG